jgi:hypothetical protein
MTQSFFPTCFFVTGFSTSVSTLVISCNALPLVIRVVTPLVNDDEEEEEEESLVVIDAIFSRGDLKKLLTILQTLKRHIFKRHRLKLFSFPTRCGVNIFYLESF